MRALYSPDATFEDRQRLAQLSGDHLCACSLPVGIGVVLDSGDSPGVAHSATVRDDQQRTGS